MSDKNHAKFYALIPCAGVGERARASGPKQYQFLAGRSVLEWTLRAFEAISSHFLQQGVVVVAPSDTQYQALWPQTPLPSTGRAKQCTTGNSSVQWTVGRFRFVPVGGATRAHTVLAGLAQLRALGAGDVDWVLVHDAARCLIQPNAIQTLIDVCRMQQPPIGALLALPMADTLKRAQQSDWGLGSESPSAVLCAVDTITRDDKWLAQTPQCFPLALLERALQQGLSQGISITDEASAVEQLGGKPQLIQGPRDNFKITYPEDFVLAEALLERRAGRGTFDRLQALRIGQGWDSHRLVDAKQSRRRLVLGGVEVAYDKALWGHSDADVLLHAITDALLGAAGLGDIGRHFPDTDPDFQGADSKVLLQNACARVRGQGYQIQNVDCTVLAQAPKLMPYIEAMRQSIAACLEMAPSQVNVKAKTAEKLGPVGEGLSMEAQAVVLLRQCS